MTLLSKLPWPAQDLKSQVIAPSLVVKWWCGFLLWFGRPAMFYGSVLSVLFLTSTIPFSGLSHITQCHLRVCNWILLTWCNVRYFLLQYQNPVSRKASPVFPDTNVFVFTKNENIQNQFRKPFTVLGWSTVQLPCILNGRYFQYKDLVLEHHRLGLLPVIFKGRQTWATNEEAHWKL